MKRSSTSIVYLLFFLSGLAGLIYEVVWGRMLVLIFGGTTNSLVATISAFLGGLALGGYLAGKFVDWLKPKTLIRGYSLLELGVGVTALMSPFLFQQIKYFYANFSDGSTVTFELLLIKFVLTTLVILIPTTLMGATLPFLARFFQSQLKLADVTLSRLYAINTFGGMTGVILAGFVLLELLGLDGTLVAAALLNFIIFLLAWNIKVTGAISQKTLPSAKLRLSANALLAIFGFSLSGFISIGYQILWTRVLTPTMGTMIYAFASILAFYLFGIALGSLIYPVYRRFVPQAKLGFGLLQLIIGIFALLPVLLLHKVVLPANWELTVRLLVPTLMMGLTFPAVLALVNQPGSTGQIIGLAYAGNTLGAILGGYLSSFFFIPFFGSSPAIVLFSLGNFFLAYLFITTEKKIKKLPYLAVCSLLLVGGVYLVTYKKQRLFPYKTDIPILEAQIQKVPYGFLEDDVATVFGKQKSIHNEPQLVIDGVATTHRVSLTKYMAHLPIYLHPNPQKVLVIAYGMGNTYRSSLKHNLITHAVELVPSVPKLSYLYHPDNFLDNPTKGKIIINDGRNYAFLTHEKYDVVIIDPPPPFNTAGSTVLHSLEYYRDLAKNLTPNGIVNQWIYAYDSRQDDISMAIRTFLEAFPYVLAVQKTDSQGGIFMLGSLSPIHSEKVATIMSDPVTFADLQEFADKENFRADSQPLEILGDRDSLLKSFSSFPLINDANPRTEYYLLRHQFTQAPNLTGPALDHFIQEIKKEYRPETVNQPKY